MVTLHLYKLKPRGWLTTTPDLSPPSGAELVLVSSAESQAAAQDKIDRFKGDPPYLTVQRVFQDALESGLTPSEAVLKVHREIGVVNIGAWIAHFNEALGINSSAVASLFIEWYPDDKSSSMSDEEFNKRIVTLKNA